MLVNWQRNHRIEKILRDKMQNLTYKCYNCDMNKNVIEKLDKYIEESLFYFDLPGLAVIAGKDDFSYHKMVGYSDFEKKEPLNEKQFFHLASVSKTFVSMSIMKLVEEGKLLLSDKLVDVLPWVKLNDDKICEVTIESMLSHTSGIGDVVDYGWDRPRVDEKALKEYVLSPEVVNSKLLWSPKENKFQYSNIAYEMLGCVISEISSLPFEDYVDASFFKPLGMDNSTFLTFRRGEKVMVSDGIKTSFEYESCEEGCGGVCALKLDVIKKAGGAMPHCKDSDNHIILKRNYPYNREHGPSSTLTSDIYDLEKWARATLDKKIFNENTYSKIWDDKVVVPNNGEKMGLGWFVREQQGKKLVGHEGTDDGFRASFWVCHEENAFVAVMSNISKSPVKKINKGVFDILCSK